MSFFKVLSERREKGLKSPSVIIPGAFNGCVARLINDHGYSAIYISGAAISGSKGLPDIGIITLNEVCDSIREISRCTHLPILVDADTGFGELEMVRRTVNEYKQSGAAALHIEDQICTKRCGHLDGKKLIATEHMKSKIKMAVEAAGVDFMIVARTDAASIPELGLQEALNRAFEYVEVGAHMIFPEGLKNKDDFASFASQLKKRYPDIYLLANMTEFGKSPSLSATELGEMEYDCVIFPVSTFRTAMGSVKSLLESLKKEEKVSPDEIAKMQTRAVELCQHGDLYKTLHYVPGEIWHFPSPSGESIADLRKI